ncbi:MAG: PAS domain-containing sensor histidine kinase [Verrucomicrobiota bacterium]|jgi:PAS domain S-box-containing protein
MKRKTTTADDSAELRRRAEARLGKQPSVTQSDFSTQRMLHELEVHRIELEMQNAELQKTRDELEVSLEKFTDLYDFAPVGYFSIDESGVILEANLKSAALLGMERSRLINRSVLLFVDQKSHSILMAFLKNVMAGPGDQECEALLLRKDGGTFVAGFRATSAVCTVGTPRWCRVAFGDITARKQAEEAQRRLEDLANTNLGLNREIVRRQTVEQNLKKSEQSQSRLLKQARHMQGQLRHLSHQVLQAQEEERMRISRDLHDEIAQTLVGINVELATLTREAAGGPKGLQQKIAHAQQMVENSVEKVHQFARKLRPALLDDLGLIPALHAFMKSFTKRTGVRTSLTAVAAVERLDTAKRTVLFRVAQEALTNVGRHAQASRVEVIIQKLPEGICMRIKDDGKSFQVDRVLHGKGSKHLGLLGMRERLEMINGSFEIESTPGNGTTITAKIPLGTTARGAR